MKRIDLRPRAVADLADIRRYTRRTWGAAQARAYLSALGSCFNAIAAGEAIGVRDLDEVEGSYRRCRHGSHLVIFEEGTDEVTVVRVLHVRMDIPDRMD